MIINRCFVEKLKKKVITTVDGADNNKVISNLLKEKFKRNDRDTQFENNGLFHELIR